MNPLDYRKNLAAFAQKMESKTEPTEEQYQYLADAFTRISKGDDANKVLGVAFQKHQTETNAAARQKLSAVLHWVAGAITPTDGDPPGLGLTLEQAFEQAAPVARKLFAVEGSEKYDASYIKKCWYAADKAHMRDPNRGHFDQDSPY